MLRPSGGDIMGSPAIIAKNAGRDASNVPGRPDIDVLFARFDETLKLVRYSATAPILAAATLVWFFWDTPERDVVSWLLGAVAVPALGAIATGWIGGAHVVSSASVKVAELTACLLAMLIGLAFGAMPILLFARSDADHRLLIIATLIGVLANVYALGPNATICALYGGPIVVGGMVALLTSGDPAAMPLAILLAIHAAFLVLSLRLIHGMSLQRLNDRARVREQNDTIDLLMRDGEETGSDWLFELDAAGRLRHVSDRLALAAGVERARLEGAIFKSIFLGRMPGTPIGEGVRSVLDAIAARRPFHDFVVEIRTPVEPMWWQLSGKPVHDNLGAFQGYRGVGFDVTAARIAEARIAYLASYDTLTGIANRQLLKTRTKQACELARVDGCPRALFYLDLDGFKGVNDGLGHAAGDVLLALVAERLKAMVPSNALVGRLGGDEFAVLCQVANAAGAEVLARSIVETLGASYRLAGTDVTISASVGIALTPDHAGDADALLLKADLALYRAKADGKARHRLFVEAYEQTLIDKRLLEDDLKLALGRREFLLHYQPLVALSTGRVAAFEALIRWTSPTRGFVAPNDFIPAAESTGLIVAIGRWVLLEACREAARWDPGIDIAVNISPQHFRSPDFVQDVVTALAVSGLHARRLEIEITEGVFLEQSTAAVENLHALRRRGVRIALDDFGTGFSSLSYLVNFPVDRIKIDRSFVKDIVRRHESRAIVDAILGLAKTLGILVTAEGVETIDQALALKQRRCDTIQGYLLSKPRPPEDVDHLVSTVPKLFASMSHALFDSPLALALAMKRQEQAQDTASRRA